MLLVLLSPVLVVVVVEASFAGIGAVAPDLEYLLAMSQNERSKDSETSSQEEECLRQELEYEQALQDREAEEEDQDEDYWKQYNEQLI